MRTFRWLKFWLALVLVALLGGCGIKAAPRPPLAYGMHDDVPAREDDDAGCCKVLR